MLKKLKINYIEEEFLSKSHFVNQSVFDPEYIPERLLHRENELIILSKIFLPLIKNPFLTTKKIIVTGAIGVGKTVTLKLFGQMIQESSIKRDANIKVIHINCRVNQSPYLILKCILENFNQFVPKRGLSPGELLNNLIEILKEQKIHLILILDELNFINNKDMDIVYILSRINEANSPTNAFISIIGIVKDLLMLNNLDDATLSSLQNEVIRFNKYTKIQIFEILKERVKLGVKDDIFSDRILELISEITYEEGDMRKALKILKNSILYIDRKNQEFVTEEIIRIVNSEFSPLSKEDLNNFNIHELLIIKIVYSLLSKNNNGITLNEIKELYKNQCFLFNETPRSNTQIWEYLQNIKNYKLLSMKVINNGSKGRKMIISMPNFPIEQIKKDIDEILNDINSDKYDKTN